MKPIYDFSGIDRRVLLSSLAMLPVLSASLRSTLRGGAGAARSAAVLERGAAKTSILDFVAARHDARRA